MNFYFKKYIFTFLICFSGIIVWSQDNAVLEDRLRNNLYLDVYVNKSECYVGEPIIATYKLYSSLQSVSTIIKNPAFPGFTFTDLISSRDDVVERETINGVKFDVHIIRKVQLTPTQSGKLQLDPLVMSNKIRLVDDNGNKSSLLNGVNENILSNGEYSLTISSIPISITVNELPETNKTPTFTGAVGDFRMNIQMPKPDLQTGEQGLLAITIAGKGDFSQVNQPTVIWPSGINVFPAKIQGQFDDTQKDGSGYKVFVIPFASDRAGSYTILPIKFSYFDAVNNRYNTIANPAITFTITEAPVSTQTESAPDQDQPDYTNALLAGGGVVLFLLILLLITRKRKSKKHYTTPAKPQPINKQDTIDVLLKPAADAVHHPGNHFYGILKQSIIQFFEQKLNVPAALCNRTSLQQAMTENHISNAQQNEILHILTEIEMNIYSGGGMQTDKNALLQKTRTVLKQFK